MSSSDATSESTSASPLSIDTPRDEALDNFVVQGGLRSSIRRARQVNPLDLLMMAAQESSEPTATYRCLQLALISNAESH